MKTAGSKTQKPHRLLCLQCRKPVVTCYCSLIRPFATRARFVILMHPEESKRAVASGRMTHRCIENSMLIEGVDFSENEKVNRLLVDSCLFPVVLFPARDAVKVEDIASAAMRSKIIPSEKQLVIFVFDGTWRNARKMRRLSENLRRLPTFALQSGPKSAFEVRKQPRPECLSTLETVHRVIDLLDLSNDGVTRPHDNLLDVFAHMVRIQVEGEAASRGGNRANEREAEAETEAGHVLGCGGNPKKYVKTA
jgi:DTW domain-containing protein